MNMNANQKRTLLTAVMMTAALGMSQVVCAQETETPADNSIETAVEESVPLKPHPIVRSTTVNDEEYNDPDDYTSYVLYAQLQYSRVYLPDDEAKVFSSLNQGLNDHYDAVESEKLDAFEQIKSDAHDQRETMEQDGQSAYWGNYTDSETAVIDRADEKVLSIRSNYYGYQGGAHGYYASYGTTFDTQTGALLSFTDVVTDPAAAAGHTFEKLAILYPDLEPLMSQEEVAKCFQENSDDFQWTLEPQGLMLYFPPYVLGSYAEGMQTVLLSYAEYPEIFASQYVSDSDNWIIPVDSMFGAQADLGEGSSVINVSGTPGEYGQYTNRIITVNGTPYTFGEGSLSYFNTESYLICSDGRMWLWCLDTIDNDYEELHIYGFENGQPSDLDYSALFDITTTAISWELTQSSADQSTLTDPKKVCLSQRMRELGTYTAGKEYFVSGSGTPISGDLFFTPDMEHSLTLKAPVTLQMVGQDGAGTDMKEWPAGTTCTILRTNGDQIVDLVMDGDDTQVARVVSDFSRWPHMINGMDESDLFDGVMYAG